MTQETGSPAPDDAEIEALRERRGRGWVLIRAVRRRRPILTALLVIAAPLHTLVAGVRPVDLLTPSGDPRFSAAWLLMIFGAAVRIWGSGNLKKNEEITRDGIYSMVRHPLYLGSLSMFLAYFITAGDLRVGLGLFLILVSLVYYPTMLAEEEYLEFRFPDQARGRTLLPRLLPNPFRLVEAVRSDRFTLGAASGNLGLRSLAFLLALPLLLRLLSTLQAWIGHSV